jgi:hypothetical protein
MSLNIKRLTLLPIETVASVCSPSPASPKIGKMLTRRTTDVHFLRLIIVNPAALANWIQKQAPTALPLPIE